jgi:hypothetical protein
VKHDGFRFICRRDGDRVRVFSRNGRDWADKVPAIVEAVLALPVTSATIDGEGVVVDDRGVTDFDKLFAALARRAICQKETRAGAATWDKTALLNHLIGTREQRWRHLDAERVCCLEVDGQLILGR